MFGPGYPDRFWSPMVIKLMNLALLDGMCCWSPCAQDTSTEHGTRLCTEDAGSGNAESGRPRKKPRSNEPSVRQVKYEEFSVGQPLLISQKNFVIENGSLSYVVGGVS